MIKLLLGVAQSGKTEKLLREADGRKDVYIITHSKQSASYLFERSKQLKLDINKPVGINDKLNMDIIPQGSELWMDDFELIMKGIFGKDKSFKLSLHDYEIEDLNKDFLKRVIDVEIKDKKVVSRLMNSAINKI